MNIKKSVGALSLALLLLALPGCADRQVPDEEMTDAKPYEARLPDAPVYTEDDTDYLAAVRAVFRDVAAAPAETFEVREDGPHKVCLTGYKGEGGRVVIPEKIGDATVVSLGDGLFADRTDLTALYIPDTVTVIGERLLSGCRSLQVLRTPQFSSTRDAEGGSGYLSYLFGASTPAGTGFYVPSSLDTVVLGGGRTSVDDQAFFECSRLKIVVLPNAMQKIGKGAFAGCAGLCYIHFPESLIEVGDRALDRCTGLKKLEIEESVTRIGFGALRGCAGLERLTLPFVGETAEENRFLGYIFGAEVCAWGGDYVPASLKRVEILDGDVPDNAFLECASIAEVILPADCTKIGIRAFYGCASLRGITLPENVTLVDEEAFAGCSSLFFVDFSENLQVLGMQAFLNCRNLYEIVLPAKLYEIPVSAFSGCRGLLRVNLGESLSKIRKNAFYNCVSLTTVEGRLPATEEGNTRLKIAVEHPEGLQE